MEKTIEQQVAETVLQRATEITIGDKTYTAAPPSTATLILVSEAVSLLPKRKLDDKDIASESLAMAKDCKALGDIAAILILGARGCKPVAACYQERRAKGWRGWLGQRETVLTSRAYDPKERLSRELLENCSPSRLHSLIASLLGKMELGDFFALTTFLTEVNLIRQTKVETAN